MNSKVLLKEGAAAPELAPQTADFPVHGIRGLVGFVQLPLQLPGFGVGPRQILLRFLQLPFQLIDFAVGLVYLQSGETRTSNSTVTNKVGRRVKKKMLKKRRRVIRLASSLLISDWRRSSSACSITSLSFFSVFLVSLAAC